MITLLFFFLSIDVFARGIMNNEEPDIYYMSKKDGYYAIFRKRGHREDVIFDSGSLLRELPGYAKYQIPYDVSPDGRYVTFSGLSKSGNMDIFLLEISSNKIINLTRDYYVDTLPVFSHDGRYIAYLSHERGGRYYENLFIISVDGRVKRRITRDYFKIVSHSFSPDDSEILFVKYMPYHSAISVVDIHSSGVRDLTNFDYSNRSPSYNNDGRKIVYVSDIRGSFDVWMMDSDGNNKKMIFESPGLEYNPRFTPDGKGIYFTSDFVFRKGKAVEGNTIYLYNLETGEVIDLLDEKFDCKKFFCFNPRFSDDMRFICFEGKIYEEDKNRHFSIYVMDMETGKLKMIASRKTNAMEPRFGVRSH